MLKGQSLGAAIGYVRGPPPLSNGLLKIYGVGVGFSLSWDRSLAPGAQVLLKVLTNPSLPPEERLDVSKQVRRLDIKDWALVLRAFNEWPFAPEVSKDRPSFLQVGFGVDRCWF